MTRLPAQPSMNFWILASPAADTSIGFGASGDCGAPVTDWNWKTTIASVTSAMTITPSTSPPLTVTAIDGTFRSPETSVGFPSVRVSVLPQENPVVARS